MRVAILAPISRPTPPSGYGPWEQVASNVAEGMAARGLDVTLFATRNSVTAGRLRSVTPVGIDEDPGLNGEVLTALHIASLFEHADEFDLIHSHLDWKPLTYALPTPSPPMLTTIHGFSSPHILAAYYAGARRSFYCSISDADRDPGLDYLATCYNGIDPQLFRYEARAGEYLLFLGRFHPEKGLHLAIEIAKRAGIPLKIAGIPQDEAYFRDQIVPHIDGKRIEFLGEVRQEVRNALLGGALALVHMTTRPERFGLTLIEAMACGTPVLGARMGSLPEIVLDGETGFLCESVEEAVAAVPKLSGLDRAAARRRVETTFTSEHMIDRYLEAYTAALALGAPPPPNPAQRAARLHDWWDRPMAYTDDPTRPRSADAIAERIVNG
jgi:glycosyltransferase involved in cell wall biosynthesis